jgi:hypothetical protein
MVCVYEHALQDLVKEMVEADVNRLKVLQGGAPPRMTQSAHERCQSEGATTVQTTPAE